MKSIDKIPVSKIERATKLVTTGAKIGVNYLKYYGNKLVKEEDEAKQQLHKDNASDIYNSLKKLKGSALKVAQMLSMEKGIMPDAFVEQFSLAQFSVPPLSAPLVLKIFKNNFGKHPNDIFDTFDLDAVNGASIGQVHLATKAGKKYAVKIQYPGIATSIKSDLKLVKPIALRMFNISGKDKDRYFEEVENKLIEETDYTLEIKQSQAVVKSCRHLPHLVFPNYYPELSSDKIITMDWLEGLHLSEFAKINTDINLANTLGQALWDFYMHQIHHLKKVHADPHPGNFLVSEKGNLLVIDFGCMKTIPEDFYIPYFELIKGDLSEDAFFTKKLYQLEILREEDTEKEIPFLKEMFQNLIHLLTKPFRADIFDFSDKNFFKQITDLGTTYFQDTDFKKINGNRGSEHFIYMHRTFMGVYNLLHALKAKSVKINHFN